MTQQGMKPDHAKVNSIKDMHALKNQNELQSLLGLVNSVRYFLPQTTSMCKPLREPCSEKVSFVWNADYQKILDELKQSITEDLTLSYYDLKKELFLETDASKKAIRAVLLQHDAEGKLKPVSFASKILTTAEQNYSIIEYELLAVQFSLTHFK